MAILADLSLRLRAQSAELREGLEKAKKSMKDTNKVAGQVKKEVSSMFSAAGSVINSIIPGFSKLTSTFGKLIPSVGSASKAMNIFKIALASTGVGALVVALGSLISYFKNTDSGARMLSKALNAIKSVIDVLTRRLSMLGESLVKLFKGDIKGAVDTAKNAFKGLGDEIANGYKTGIELETRRQKLEDERIAFIVREQELVNKIAKAKETIRNDEVSTLEKQKALNEANAAANELYETRLRFGKEERDIMLAQNALSDNLQKDYRAEEELKAQVLSLDEARSNEMKFLNSMQRTLNKEIQNETKERQAAFEELKKKNELMKVSLEPLKVADINVPQLQALKLDFTLPEEEITTAATLYETAWTNALESVQEMLSNTAIESIPLFMTLIDVILGAADSLSTTLKEGGESFTEFAQNAANATRSVIGGLIAEGVTAAITSAMSSPMAKINPIFIPVIAGLAAGLAKTAFNSLIPKFAAGGIAYGPTLGLVGEYAGARTNPEVIAPLDKLPELLGYGKGGNDEVVFRIRGTDLEGIRDKQYKIISAY